MNMKTVKAIVVLITILVAVFFSIGLFVKETVYTTQISVNKPVEDVFAIFNDFEKKSNWIPEFKSVEYIEKKEGKVGSTYKIVLEKNGQKIIMKEKVLAFVPNEKITLNYGVEGMLKMNDYNFKAEGEVTTITQKSTCKSDGYIMSCIFPFFKSKFKEQDQLYLNNFKSYIDKL